jgi:hypothetical protein
MTGDRCTQRLALPGRGPRATSVRAELHGVGGVLPTAELLAGITGPRPNRKKLYSVRLSAEEKPQSSASPPPRPSPPQPSSAPGSSNDSTANAPPDVALSAANDAGERPLMSVSALGSLTVAARSPGALEGVDLAENSASLAIDDHSW